MLNNQECQPSAAIPDNTNVAQNSTKAPQATSSPTSLSYPKFDKQQAIEQLRLLNYQDGDEVFLRAIYPTKHKKRGAISFNFKFPNFPVKDIEKYQREQRGIYVVVNGQGHSDAPITQGRALFFEYDDREKSAQINIWQELRLPSPTFQIDTGGKSIHHYYVFEDLVPIAEWKSLTDDFLGTIGNKADPSNCNASRVFRLAGTWYINADGSSTTQSRIITRDGGNYDFQQLRDLIPHQENTKKKVNSLEIPIDSPDIETLEAPQYNETLEDKIYIASRILKDGYLDAYVDVRGGQGKGYPPGWLDIGMALHSIDDSLVWHWDAWSQKSSSKYKEGECEELWQGFTANKGYTMGTLTALAKEHGWEYPKDKLPSKRNSSQAESTSKSAIGKKNNEEIDSTESCTRLKLEIKAYIQETDLFKKKLIKSKICTNYHQSKQDFEELVAEAEKLEITPEKVTFTFEEFINVSSDSLDWLIPGILPKGETILLSALAKCGKTNLAFDAIKALLAGGNFLGERLNAGKVLLVSSDESVNSTRRRLLNTGISELSNKNNLLIRTHLDITKLNVFEEELKSFKPDLVVIDSLTSVCSDVGVSENEAKFATYIYKLKEKLAKYGASAILIHHENKDVLAKGINKISGSARISAAVWGIWQLSAINPDDHNDTQRKLTVTPREAEKASFKLEMNPRDAWLEESIFNFLGEVGDENGEKKSNGEKIIQLLESSMHPLTHSDINAVLNLGKSLYVILDRLVDRQIVAKSKKPGTRTWLYAKNKNQ